MTHWTTTAVIYHLYPLGALGAPAHSAPPATDADRTAQLYAWLDHLLDVGADTVLLGPVFESGTHGYDTHDLYRVDRRLGSNENFARWCAEARGRGVRLVLDGVFHHVGRGFWAFRDVLEHGQASAYRDWFHLDFQRRSGRGDPFAYRNWGGHDDLVKLNVANPDVRRHLFDAVRFWVEAFGIDGLRLDAADVLDLDFQRDLARFCRDLRPDFWLLGEVIHGDYRRWVNPDTLDSVTNYEAHKGLYSSHNDRNYFEIAHSLDRQFGERGAYRRLNLGSFADNHDVERIATRLRDPAHLYPLHVLLFTMPGVPTLYYGSELGVPGRKERGTDAPLRPALDPARAATWGEHPHLLPVIRRLADLRRAHPALQTGDYRQLHVASEQFAFERATPEERLLVAVNAAPHEATLTLRFPGAGDGELVDALGGPTVSVRAGQATVAVEANWGRVLRWTGA